jgi:uncharacterized membrane protein YeaQ/YmgE (transglycosylase-associated protein family)
MSVLAWMALGLIAGLVASNLFSRSGQGLLLDLTSRSSGKTFDSIVC